LTGDAFTFVSPDEQAALVAIERVLGRSLPRVTLPGFDYASKPNERLEIPLQERLAAHRAARGTRRSPRDGSPRPPARPPKARQQRPPRSGSGGSGLERRLESILDRHAPLSSAPARKGPRAKGRRG
jgi:superfamily II DNA/RNA helicase